MSAGLILHGLRSARPRQLRARLLRPLRRGRFPAGPRTQFRPLEAGRLLWSSPAFEHQELPAAGRGTRLYAFHRHYGEDVLAHARAGDPAAARRAIEAWIAANPPRRGDAWHPYTVSTRAGNWIAALSLLPDAQSEPAVASLRDQLAYLAGNVEDDILGNHVVRNARALALGGAAFGHAPWLEGGVELLARELPEQVLPDGGHYERSPVYHAVVLRDLLEIEIVTGGKGDHVRRMQRFAADACAPNAVPAPFNDGPRELAPHLDVPEPRDGASVFADTGYVFWRAPGAWLAFDCGPPAPPFLPPHAHADCLSFQLWLGGTPAIVDAGTFTYEPGPDRDWFRGTRAHATVQLDGRDQFTLWGAFRAGPMPRVELLEASDGSAAASVQWSSGPRHTRTIRWSPDAVEVHDRVDGSGRHLVESRLPLAPGARVEVEAHDGAHVRERGWLSERLFERTEIDVAVQRVERALPVELGWTIRAP